MIALLMSAKILTLSLETQRQSFCLQSSQHILESYYESQSSLKQQPADSKTSQPVKVTSNMHVSILSSVKASALVPSRVQVQG